MNKKIQSFLCLTLALLMFCTTAIHPAAKAKEKASKGYYSWYISLNKELKGSRIKNANGHKLVVIDSQNYSASDIAALKKAGHTVYSYLNIGSVESNRYYYRRFKSLRLKTYANWEDEYWVNVGKKRWRDFIIKTIADKMAKKGIDGFWVDNCDVYEYNKRKSIFNGLVKILRSLHKYGKPVILNGGDQFVTPLIKSGNKYLINGVVQEEVTTKISSYSGSGSFGTQRKDFQRYYENYFKHVKKAGLSVGVLEYTRSSGKRDRIRSYCRRKGFNYCIKSTIII